LCSSANGLSRFAIQRDDCFRRDLPGDLNIREPGIHRRYGLLSSGRVKRELNQRHKLVQWLVLRKPAGCEAARQIERAEFERKTPVQRVDIARERRAKLAGIGIDSEVYRASGQRGFECEILVSAGLAGAVVNVLLSQLIWNCLTR